MKRYIPLMLIALSAAWTTLPMSAHADTDSADELPADNRIRMLSYNAGDIYTITTRVGYQTNIEFNEREEVDTISVGDRSFWQIIPSGNRLFIRPLQDDVSTNMTVITNKRSYQFDLQSISDPEKKIIYVARFTYPDEHRNLSLEQQLPFLDPNILQQPKNAQAILPPIAHNNAPYYPGVTAGYVPQEQPPAPAPSTAYAAPVQPQPAYVPPAPAYTPPAPPPQPAYVPPAPPPEPAPVALTPTSTAPISTLPASPVSAEPITGKRNYLYTFSGSENAAPYEVFDDGMTTYFRFASEPESIPSVALSNKDVQTPLTVYRKSGYYAVDRVAPEMVIRTGGETVYVFNEMLTTAP